MTVLAREGEEHDSTSGEEEEHDRTSEGGRGA